MGIFHVSCVVENIRKPANSASVRRLMVDSGAEYTWIPAGTLEKVGVQVTKKDVPFLMANGQVVTRNIGYAIIRVGEFETVDEVVFAERGDLRSLGARTLEGFAAMVDPRKKKLVAAGPIRRRDSLSDSDGASIGTPRTSIQGSSRESSRTSVWRNRCGTGRTCPAAHTEDPQNPTVASLPHFRQESNIDQAFRANNLPHPM